MCFRELWASTAVFLRHYLLSLVAPSVCVRSCCRVSERLGKETAWLLLNPRDELKRPPLRAPPKFLSVGYLLAVVRKGKSKDAGG